MHIFYSLLYILYFYALFIWFFTFYRKEFIVDKIVQGNTFPYCSHGDKHFESWILERPAKLR